MAEIGEYFLADMFSFIRSLVYCIGEAEVDKKTSHDENFRYWLFRFCKDIEAAGDPTLASVLLAQFDPTVRFEAQDM